MYDASSWFIIRFLVIMYDQTIISQQLPQYTFDYQESNTNNYITYTYPNIVASEVYSTYIYGISYFYNNQSTSYNFYFYT